jgi:ribonucleoside-diphosphate reductase alpha chain
MFVRLANEFYRIEQQYPKGMRYMEIYELFKDFKYVIPGGSMLYGVGNDASYSSLGNCFVIGDQTDSYSSILKIDEEQVQLMKRRGGVGHDLSHLRPKGSKVSNAAVTSTGAVSFMDRYSHSTREVAQGGRRGALMLTMSIDHPDIEDFITAKDDLTKITGANISVKVTDAFMKSLADGDERAVRVWGKLVHQAWKSAEPGVLFWDTIINNSPADKYPGFQSISTNPCGEIPLCAYDTCRLMSINLFSFVLNPFTKDATFDWDTFFDVVWKAQRLMDDAVDLEREKIEKIILKIMTSKDMVSTTEVNLWYKIKEKLLQGRRTGLSAIGLADCFAALGLTYGSKESISFANLVYEKFNKFAYASSENMAVERGAFPAFYSELLLKDDPMFNTPFHVDERSIVERRNIALLTIPPSGSLSILAGISSGIEPVFNLSYTRRRKVEDSDNVVFVDKSGDKWEEYKIYHPKYEEYGRPKAYIGGTAHDVAPLDRVMLQATIQRWIDHSISSTINLPTTATPADIAEIYIAAYKNGCKGITVYRDGCRDGILINKGDQKSPVFEQHNAPKRPKKLVGDVKIVKVKGVEYCVIVGLFDGKPYEVFARDNTFIWEIMKPSPGKCVIVKEGSGQYDLIKDKDNYGTLTELLSPEQKAITRLVSTALRHGTDIKFIVEQLNKTTGDLTGFSNAIARVLKQYITNGSHLKGSTCEVCDSKLVIENGCEICKSCGYTRCS